MENIVSDRKIFRYLLSFFILVVYIVINYFLMFGGYIEPKRFNLTLLSIPMIIPFLASVIWPLFYRKTILFIFSSVVGTFLTMSLTELPDTGGLIFLEYLFILLIIFAILNKFINKQKTA